MQKLVLMTVMIVGVLVSRAGLSDEVKLYNKALPLTEELYLWPDRMEPKEMFKTALIELSHSLHWLIFSYDEVSVTLSHGDGRTLTTVPWPVDMTTLVTQLSAVQSAVEAEGGLGDVDVEQQLTEGIFDALDRHSKVMSGAGLDRFSTRIKGAIVGIGAMLRVVDHQLTVISLLDGGPAKMGGLQEGDLIMRVDGVSMTNMPLRESTRRIRGNKGSTVLLDIVREGSSFELALARDSVFYPSVHKRIIKDEVGYIKIDNFSKRVSPDFIEAIVSLRAEGALEKGLILDLRGNTGGSMRESARCADQFLTEGLLVRTVGRDGGEVRNLITAMRAQPSGSALDVPVVVLTDRRTASGSEIVAGALVQNGRAITVGTDSFGKGTVQKLYRLDKDRRLKLTVAEYLLEDDLHINEVGLQADLRLGEVYFSAYRPKFVDWDPRLNAGEALPFVSDQNRESDAALDFAAEVVMLTTGSDRASLLNSAKAVFDARMPEAVESVIARMAEEGIDWTVGPGQGEAPEVDVKLTSSTDPANPEVAVVMVEVMNQGDEALTQLTVTLESETNNVWDGLIIPVGRIAPSEWRQGALSVGLPTGLALREDVVTAVVRSAGYTSEVGFEQLLTVESAPPASIGIESRLTVEGNEGTVSLKVENLTEMTLKELEIFFLAPGDIPVELIDRATIIPELPSGLAHTVNLKVKINDPALTELPMRLVVESDRYKTIARWEADLPIGGEVVLLRPPEVIMPKLPLSSALGTESVAVSLSDDGAIAHAELYHNGLKLAWAGEGSTEIKGEIALDVGANYIVVIATDDQGLRARSSIVVRGY